MDFFELDLEEVDGRGGGGGGGGTLGSRPEPKADA